MGGGLARLWSGRGRQVTALGRDGGDATDDKVVVIAVAAAQVPGALDAVSGLAGQPTTDACNIYTDRRHEFPSLSRQIQSIIGGPTAKTVSAGYEPVYVGPLDPGARLLEDSSGLTRAVAAQLGPFFYRHAQPGQL